MNQKILGIVPLIVAMLFVAAFAVGDNSVSAANTAGQTATVNVNQNIAITVSTDVTMTGADGTTLTSNSYIVNNTGNVQVFIYARANNAAFSSGTTGDTIPILGNYQIKNQGGTYTGLTTADQKITTTKLDTLNHGNNYLTLDQKLAVPSGVESATYTNGLTYTAMTS
jgi:hypothetical protein